MIKENEKNGLYYYLGAFFVATASFSVGALLLMVLYISLGI
ncbi:hypothetical protein [Flavobacterium sp. K5-23]|nr:hypothetical protein [Flavobacterium sp. K5-23]